MPEREGTDIEQQADGAANSDNTSGASFPGAGEHEAVQAPGELARAPQHNVLASLPRHRPGTRTKRRSPAAGGRGARAAASTTGPGAKAPSPNSSPKATREARSPKRASSARASTRKKAPTPRAGAAVGAGAGSPANRAKRTPGQSGSGLQIPAQGFETEGVRMGTAVEPPSRVEMATSLIEAAAEGFEELAKAGAVVGSAALKRALSLLPKP